MRVFFRVMYSYGDNMRPYGGRKPVEFATQAEAEEMCRSLKFRAGLFGRIRATFVMKCTEVEFCDLFDKREYRTTHFEMA